MNNTNPYTPQDVKKHLKEIGAMHIGHFVDIRGAQKGMGWHSRVFLDETRLIMHPQVLQSLAEGIVHKLQPFSLDMLVAPSLGSMTLTSFVAATMGLEFAFLERREIERDVFKSALRDKRIALTDTFIRGGNSLRVGIAALRKCGGIPVAASGVWNYGDITGGALAISVFCPLINEVLGFWSSADCTRNGPCSRSVPINRSPGYGADLEMLPEGRSLPFV